MNPTIQLIRKRRGMMALIGRRLDLRWSTVNLWKQVPLIHVFDVAEILRLPPERIRPDFFCKDPLRKDQIPPSMRCEPAKWTCGWERKPQRKTASKIATQTKTVKTKSAIEAISAR